MNTLVAGQAVIVDGLEEATVVAAAGDIIVVSYTTIAGDVTEATVNQERVTLA